MIKMQIIMDDEKIAHDKNYNVQIIHDTLDSYFVNKLGMQKGSDGFYLGSGSGKDFSRFGLAYSNLSEKSWFLENVKTWLYFNSDASYDSDDFVVEDFKQHCLNKLANA
jgi:NADH:ubiquinone oxidoreductase subunit